MLLKKSKWLLYRILCLLFISAFALYVPTAQASPTATEEAEPSPTATDTVADTANTQTGTVNTVSNLREQPSTATSVLVQMNQGEQVSVLESVDGGWLKVTYFNQTGYVRADYVDVMVTGLSESAVMIGDVTMTSQPGSGDTIASLTYNTQVTITGTYGTYYQITTSESQSGYVPKASVHRYRIISLNLSATMNSSNVNVRSTPVTGEVIDVMKSGTEVTVVSIQDKWAKISYSGKEGYVRGDFVTYTVPSGSHLTTLSQGMKCQAVTQLQIALKNKGFFYPAANGVYGNATKAAVAKFQAAMNLDSDGIAGPQTLLVLLGKTAANNLWNNYRTSMEAQEPQQNGQVYLVDWFDGMEDIVTKMEPFEVIDVRTGIHWNMERFGGWWHADVETMTKEDTEAMTEAWGGELNPTRRPVWVKIDGKYYAAGLMGYVHNTDTIASNGMDGQICLHFRGSKIHGSGRVDEAHQACIQEAFAKAYRLDAYIEEGLV